MNEYIVDRKELNDLLTYLKYTDEIQVPLGKTYLTEIVKMALNSLEDKKEDLDYET